MRGRERYVDQILEDSFPASDPPSWSGSISRVASAPERHRRHERAGQAPGPGTALDDQPGRADPIDPRSGAAPHRRRRALPASLPRPEKLTRHRTSGPSPPAHVRVIDGAIHEEERDYIARKLGMKLGKFVSSVERVTVRLSDTNGPKGGRDQKCQIKVVLNGLPSVVVEETDATLAHAVDRAVASIEDAVRRRVQRRRLKPLHHRNTR